MPVTRRPARSGRAARLLLGALLIAVLVVWLVARPLLPLGGGAADGTPLAWALHGVAWASFVAGVGVVAAAWPRSDGRDADAPDAGDEPPADLGRDGSAGR